MDRGELTDRPAVSDGSGRHESPEQRDDRNLQDLLQELRVAAIGVQVLFGFLLSIPFTTRFHLLDGGQRGLYLASLLLAALATVLLSGPVAYHRLVFRRHGRNASYGRPTRWPSAAWPPWPWPSPRRSR